jgi:hypothetical protein
MILKPSCAVPDAVVVHEGRAAAGSRDVRPIYDQIRAVLRRLPNTDGSLDALQVCPRHQCQRLYLMISC